MDPIGQVSKLSREGLSLSLLHPRGHDQEQWGLWEGADSDVTSIKTSLQLELPQSCELLWEMVGSLSLVFKQTD